MSDVEEMRVTAIAPWFGSFRLGADRVGREMGDCEWAGVAFAGGCCEIPHIEARTIVVNDLHRHVINLARVMADPKLGPALYRKLRRYVLHPDTVVIAQARCALREQDKSWPTKRDANAVDLLPDLWWAEDYFVSAWGSRSCSAGSKDEFSSGLSLRWESGGGDSAVRFHQAAREIPGWRRALRHCSFCTLDAMMFLDKCKDLLRHSIYCDPPFPGPGDHYKFRVDETFHRAMARKLATFQNARVVCRFYDHPLIREIYPEDEGWTWLRSKGRTQANKDAPEVLLLNGPSYAAMPGSMFA